MFAHPILYEITGSGDAMKCRAYTKMSATGTDVEMTVSMAMAKKELWTKNPKWSSMPELMLRYRSAMFLIRTYAPEVLYGMSEVDEVHDMAARPVAVEVADGIRDKIAKKRKELPDAPSVAKTVDAGTPVDDLGEKDVETQEPAKDDEPSDANPFPLDDGEQLDESTGEITTEEPEPEPETEDDAPQQSVEEERQTLVATYMDLCQELGIEPKKINRLTNNALRKANAEMTKKIKEGR